MLEFWRWFRQRVQTLAEFSAWLRIGALVLVMPLLLRFWHLQHLLRWLNTSRRTTVAPERLAYYVDGWLNHIGGGLTHNCLRRSLVLFYALRLVGWPVQFHLGLIPASLKDRQPQGHAWLTHTGLPCFEPQAEGLAAYVITYSFPPASASSQARSASEVATHC